MKYGVRRKIVGVEFCRTVYNRTGEGSVRLTFECGHQEYRKRSKHRGGQEYANCRRCWTNGEDNGKPSN